MYIHTTSISFLLEYLSYELGTGVVFSLFYNEYEPGLLVSGVFMILKHLT